tara:strand:- start:256 stop:978 length:723 start_codon:yes stop_codon:yes gene_type:complete
MRHGRAKSARKTLKFLRLNFGLSPPYHVLVDGTFLAEATFKHIPIKDRITKTLQGELFELFVLRNVINEMLLLGDRFKDVVKFALNECTILEDAAKSSNNSNSNSNPKDGSNFILNEVGPTNEKKYFVATQDGDLADELRRIPNTPLMRIHNTVLCFESLSNSSKFEANKTERKKLTGSLTEEEKEAVLAVKAGNFKRRREESKAEAPPDGGRVRKKAKGPNPLSLKKKDPEKKKKRKKN